MQSSVISRNQKKCKARKSNILVEEDPSPVRRDPSQLTTALWTAHGSAGTEVTRVTLFLFPQLLAIN
jgi:hypothetical protein